MAIVYGMMDVKHSGAFNCASENDVIICTVVDDINDGLIFDRTITQCFENMNIMMLQQILTKLAALARP